MKLYELYIENNLDNENWECQRKLIVANSTMEAEIRAESWARYTYTGYVKPSFSIKEITEVDGFKVSVSRQFKRS